MDKIVKTLQEGHAQWSKASEETNKRLIQVFEEQNHYKRHRDCLDQDLNKLFNVYQNMKPQPQGHFLDNPYHQEDIKPDAILVNKERSPSQYQDEDNMSYSEKEALKQLPEASRSPKFSGTGGYEHMELINHIYGHFIDVPSIPDYWITARLNKSFKGHASIWWKTKIIQKYSNVTWIWQKTMSFENDNYSAKKDPYESRELEHAVKCRCNQICTLDDISGTLEGVRKRTNIVKYSPYKSSGFIEKQPFQVEFKDKPRERVAEVTKKENSCHNCGSTSHYSNRCPKAKNNVYAIEQVPEEEFPTEDSESDSMGDSIREQSDEDQDPREDFLVDYQEEKTLEIPDIWLEEGMPPDTANKNLCKHTQDAQTFLVTPTKEMAYIHGTATGRSVWIDNAQHSLIIDSVAHF
ncbi:hypothetical protein O181_006590 [Austropuccinia psidii MF-1]|uniref:CCHC-type domain-containing protein n=1 Tax=Austropuccinia psidii MF-1 TaxID=1389203 RepID=A0A9Q3BLA7_9BASI|nr:hypothetical protein [Austropuccinia psidii MF-1]